MPSSIYFENRLVPSLQNVTNVSIMTNKISQNFGVRPEDLYATVGGRLYTDAEICDGSIRFFTRLLGGKGGFGSMLRAIGAQIEKTTNREACRDLSGRRLRDINEEKRLRKWLDGKEEREREAVERKQKKLERLMAEPKINVAINDPTYEKERQDLPERVSASLDAGWQAAGSSTGTKRKAGDEPKKNKKSKLWIDADLSDCSSVSDSDEEKEDLKPAVSTDSGNDSDPTSASVRM